MWKEVKSHGNSGTHSRRDYVWALIVANAFDGRDEWFQPSAIIGPLDDQHIPARGRTMVCTSENMWASVRASPNVSKYFVAEAVYM